MRVRRASFNRTASSVESLNALIVSSEAMACAAADRETSCKGKRSEASSDQGYDVPSYEQEGGEALGEFACGNSTGESVGNGLSERGCEVSAAAVGVRTVRGFSIALPPRPARASTLKPKATLVVSLEGGGACELKLPVSFARSLKQDAIALPCPAEAFFQELERLEAQACSGELLSLLERRDHSREEARRKLLQRGYLPRFVDPALEAAVSRRFIVDSRYAACFIDEKKRAGWGRRRIESELKRRGVRIEEVDGYPDEFFEPEGELDRARAALMRKRIPEERAYEKLVRFLMGRGFSYSVAADAVRERLSDERL